MDNVVVGKNKLVYPANQSAPNFDRFQASQNNSLRETLRRVNITLGLQGSGPRFKVVDSASNSVRCESA